MIKARQVSDRCTKTSLDISRELYLLEDVVTGGVYFVVISLSSHTGNLAECVGRFGFRELPFCIFLRSKMQHSVPLSLGRLLYSFSLSFWMVSFSMWLILDHFCFSLMLCRGLEDFAEFSTA